MIVGNNYQEEFDNDNVAFIILKQQEKTKKKDHFSDF